MPSRLSWSKYLKIFNSKYGVLPFAIDYECIMAYSYNKDNDVIVNHVRNAQFPSKSFDVYLQEKIQTNETYIKYFKAGYLASLNDLIK